MSTSINGDFTGKVVVITGAGTGIGAATARRFAQGGAKVVVAGRRAEKLNEIAASLPAESCLAHPTDVSDKAACESLIREAIERFSRLDILVNNAGAAAFGKFLETPDDEWRRVLSTNVDGTIHCTRAALPHLLGTNGNIVNVSSVSGIGGDWGLSYYNASKGAVTNLTRALALEFGGQGVRVNAVAPSLTLTDMSSGLTSQPAVMAKFADRIPMGRGADPAEVADVIAFLASHAARFVNGVILPVDGGLSASNGQPRFL